MTPFGGGPARDTASAWGDKVAAPSLRRPVRPTKRRKLPALVVPIVAGVGVVALLAVGLTLLLGREQGGAPAADPTLQPSPISTVSASDSTAPTPATPGSSSSPGTTPGSTPGTSASTPAPAVPTYTPPAGAVPVAFGVSVVPVDGWRLLEQETQGKQFVSYATNGEPRAFFWVRQRKNLSAKEYLLRIVEGETAGETTQLGKDRSIPCPRDSLVECSAITYTSVAKGVHVQGFVETYRRSDGVVTGLDFRTRTDFAKQAQSDAARMRQSVLDSL